MLVTLTICVFECVVASYKSVAGFISTLLYGSSQHRTLKQQLNTLKKQQVSAVRIQGTPNMGGAYHDNVLWGVAPRSLWFCRDLNEQ